MQHVTFKLRNNIIQLHFDSHFEYRKPQGDNLMLNHKKVLRGYNGNKQCNNRTWEHSPLVPHLNKRRSYTYG